MTETSLEHLFELLVWNHLPSPNIEGKGLMSCTGASHWASRLRSYLYITVPIFDLDFTSNLNIYRIIEDYKDNKHDYGIIRMASSRIKNIWQVSSLRYNLP